MLIGAGIYLVAHSDFVDELLYEINYWEIQVEGLENRDDLKSFNLVPNVLKKTVEVAEESYERLLNEVVEESDLVELMVEMDYLYSYPTPQKKPQIYYGIGQKRYFYIPDDDGNSMIKAVLAGKSEHLYFWVEEGLLFHEEVVTDLVEKFELEIYPMNLALFGSEWSPGIDGDKRINILFTEVKFVDSAAFFQRGNEYSKKVFNESNGTEMFIVNADVLDLNDEGMLGVLAHEHLHLIQWYADQNEDLWFDEGLAELANYLSGYSGNTLIDNYYVDQPDMQLNDWSVDLETEHYDASFLFSKTLFDRLSKDKIFDLLQSSANSLQSVTFLLEEQPIFDELRNRDLVMEDLVLDWMITNLILDEDVMDGRFDYDNYANAIQVEVGTEIIPIAGEEKLLTVHQFGADYLKVNAVDGFEMHFDGDDLIRLLDVPATEGDFVMWSMHEAYSVSRLMKEFDLSDVEGRVTLDFDIWYDLDESDEFVMLMISTDEGENWTSVRSLYNEVDSDDDFYYWAGNSEGWKREKIDLTQFSGEKVLVRFESLFSEQLETMGMCLDNVRLNAIGFSDGFENEGGRWITNGFVRVNDLLPQGFAVAAVIDDGEEKMVEYLTLDAGNQFDFSIGAGEAENVTFVITGTTLFVTDEAGYKIEFR